MSTNDRGGLKAAFANFNRRNTDAEAEVKLLGREVVDPPVATEEQPRSYQPATSQVGPASALVPKPLLHREPVRQLSFRCGVGLANELKRKAAFNQLEQQEIIAEGIRRVLMELPDPPADWQG